MATLVHKTDYVTEGLARLPQQYQGLPRMAALVKALLGEVQAVEDAMFAVYSGRELQNASAVFPIAITISTGGGLGTMQFTYTLGGGVSQGPVVSSSAVPTGFTWNVPGSPFFVLFTPLVYGGLSNYTILSTGAIVATIPASSTDIAFSKSDLLAKLGKIVGQASDYGLNPAIYALLIQGRIATNASRGLRGDMINVASLLMPGVTIYCKDFGGSGGAAFYIEPKGQINPGLSPYIIAQQFLGKAISAGVALVFVATQAPLATSLVFANEYAAGFTAGPPVSNAGVTPTQCPGNEYAGGFAAGPAVSGDGGGTLYFVVEVLGGP